jgi:high mobility group protein B1
MDAEARQKYTDLSAKDKARYQNEKAAYKGKTMAKKEKDPNAPKRPLSAYLYYASERRPNLKKEDPTLSFIDATKQIALEWKIMTPVAREKWTKLAAADNDRYTYLTNKTKTTQTTLI